MKKTASKALALLLTAIIAFSSFAVLANAANGTDLINENRAERFQVAGGATADTATKVALGESVFSQLNAEDSVSYYKVLAPDNKGITFSFKSDKVTDVTITNGDSVKKSIVGKTSFTEEFTAAGFYTIAVKNFDSLKVESPVNATVEDGDNFKFTVKASKGSGNYFYQWQVAGENTWQDIDGATAATYSATASMALNGKQYRCVVTDGVSEAVYSTSATLNVTKKFEVTLSTGKANNTFEEGDELVINAEALNAPAACTYTWESSFNGGQTWNTIYEDSTINTSYKLPGTLALISNGAMFKCTVKSGSKTVTKTVTITVVAKTSSDDATLAAMDTSGYTANTFVLQTKSSSMNAAAAITLSDTSLKLVSGDEKVLKVSDIFNDDLHVFWRIKDDTHANLTENSILKIDQDGKITIKNRTSNIFDVDKEVTVQAVFYFNNVAYFKSCTITAQPENIFFEPKSYATTAGKNITLGVGASRTVAATTNMSGASIKWTSSAPDVVSVTNGKMTAVSVGTAIITANVIDASGKPTNTRRTITVNVKDNVTSVADVKFNSHDVTTRVNDEVTLGYTFTVSPENGKLPTNSKVTFVSSDPSIATVNEDGRVTGVKEGSVTITITADDGGFTDTCKVTVGSAIPNWLMIIIAPIRLIYNLILMIIGK